jgi:putative OPT family oligopeptide transporter
MIETAAPAEAGKRVELTVRGLILGVVITFFFTAANVFLGLKVALTFATSIPAAVISMALLRPFKTSTIWENNIVQTVASAAGTLSSVIFVLPGLVMIGWWTHFPYWASFGICVVGGVLGVMYTIPLRRALVTQSTLPYPEGVAAAEVLKVGAGSRAGMEASQSADEAQAGFWTIVWSSVLSAAFAAATQTKVMLGEVGAYFRLGAGGAATGVGGSMSLALVGAGHLMGIAVGMAMLAGLIIAWGIAVPVLTYLHPVAGSAAVAAGTVWRTQVRFFGAGAIGTAAIWTLGKLALPVWRGLASAVRASNRRAAPGAQALERSERDLPLWIVGLICLLTLPPMAWLLHAFLKDGPLASMAVPLILGAIAYVVIAGFLVAAVCGYMAGLIGSSNSPVSGLAILAVLGAAVLLTLFAKATAGAAGQTALVAFSLFVTSILLTVATIANDNLQDLKTGQLVDATPWRQQVALLVGVLAGAAVIPPVLDLLNHAFGFAGSNAHAIAQGQPLAAPQATLIATLAQGVIVGDAKMWPLLGVGALVGAALVMVDEALRLTKRYALPPLATGLAIYLPMAVTAPVIIGAVVGWLYDRWAGRLGDHAEPAKRLGVLLASGLIVGESLFNVALAAIIGATSKGEPLALVGDGFAPTALVISIVVAVAAVVGGYGVVGRVASALRRVASGI